VSQCRSVGHKKKRGDPPRQEVVASRSEPKAWHIVVQSLKLEGKNKRGSKRFTYGKKKGKASCSREGGRPMEREGKGNSRQ